MYNYTITRIINGILNNKVKIVIRLISVFHFVKWIWNLIVSLRPLRNHAWTGYFLHFTDFLIIPFTYSYTLKLLQHAQFDFTFVYCSIAYGVVW